jgi:hypothetical protein
LAVFFVAKRSNLIMTSKDIFANLQQAVDFMDRHPVAIAVAMTPLFRSQLPIGTMRGGAGIIQAYSGLRTYIWNDLPEPYRIYYNQTILDRDIALYNS